MARVRLSLYLGETFQKLGPGKVRRLEAVRDHGSISAAAREMGMACRHAWLLIDELNGLRSTDRSFFRRAPSVGGSENLP